MKSKGAFSVGAIVLMVILVTGCTLPKPTPTLTPTKTLPQEIYLVTARPTETPIATHMMLHLPMNPITVYDWSMFWENFEDNDLSIPSPPWNAGTRAMGYDDVINGGGDGYWLRFFGPDVPGLYHDTGLAHILGDGYDGIRPTYISYHFFAWADPTANVGYFVLTGRINPDQTEASLPGIQLYAQGQAFSVNGNTYAVPTNWDAAWSLVEFKNIQWESDLPKFDLYVDGTLLGGCISFINPLGDFRRLQLYNFDYGYVGYDNIFMGIGVGENAAGEPHCDDTPAPPPPAPPQATTTNTSAPVVCSDLDSEQCSQHPQECRWVVSLTTGAGGYCTNAP